MRGQRAGRRHRARLARRRLVPDIDGAAEDLRERLHREPTEAQDAGCAPAQVDDRGLDADGAGPTVEHEVDVGAEVGPDVSGGGGTHPAEPVGRRRRDPGAEGRQQLQRQRLGGHPQPDGRRRAGDGVGHVVGPGQDERERPGPERLGQGPGLGRDLGRPCLDGRGVGQVDDQRVVPGPTLHGEDATHGGGVGGVGTEPVDGLRREGHQPAPAEDGDGGGDVGRDQGVLRSR